jgi:hypothetical protein
MQRREHSVIREGTIAGIVGAVVAAVWLFVFDMATGRPLQTPNAVGRVLFAGDLNPGARVISPEAILGFGLVHLITFLVGGIALTALAHLVSRSPALRMGLWIGLVVAFGYFAGIAYMLTTSTGGRVPFWSLAGGNFLALGAMAWYLWRRHPQLGIRAPLGSEVRATPHAPGAPQGTPHR